MNALARSRPARSPRRRTAPARAVLALLWLAAAVPAALPAVPAADTPYAQGDRVAVTGVVADPSGTPLPGLRVVLEASRSYFNLRQMRQDRKDVRRVAAVTDERGAYSLVWPWDDYFNTFELVVAMPVKTGTKETFQELQRQDLTQRLLRGGPVVAAVTVADAGRLRKVREFVAGVGSDDERRVYGEMGRPDQVRRVKYPDHEEVSWWYFEKGRMYRFTDGRLEQVIHFDPVKAF